jgi:hypothetical protein
MALHIRLEALESAFGYKEDPNYAPPDPRMVMVLVWKRPTNLEESENVEYQILTENAPSEPCSISRIKAEFLIQLDVPFGFGGMTARWSGRSL